MNALSQTFSDMTGVLAKATRAPSINIGPSVKDFFGCDGAAMSHLQSVAQTLVGASIEPTRFVHMVNAEDFAILKAFVTHLDSEFAIAGVCRRDTATDQQRSPDGYGVMDQHQV